MGARITCKAVKVTTVVESLSIEVGHVGLEKTLRCSGPPFWLQIFYMKNFGSITVLGLERREGESKDIYSPLGPELPTALPTVS